MTSQNRKGSFEMKSCVLAYSGGLDTSVILGLADGRRLRRACRVCRLGTAMRRPRGHFEEGARYRGEIGPDCRRSRRALPRFCVSGAAWQAKYEGMYLMGTSIARPLISKKCLQVAREVKADAYAHGATGKGNDQCRFQLAAEALDPNIRVIAPWRIEAYRAAFPGRTEMIDFCDQRRISR